MMMECVIYSFPSSPPDLTRPAPPRRPPPPPPPSPRPPKNVAAKRADVIAKMKMLTDQKAQVARRFNSELIVKLGWLDQSIISTTLKLFKFDVSCLLLNDVRSSS